MMPFGSLKDNGAIIDLTLNFPLNAPQLKLYLYISQKLKKIHGSSGELFSYSCLNL